MRKSLSMQLGVLLQITAILAFFITGGISAKSAAAQKPIKEIRVGVDCSLTGKFAGFGGGGAFGIKAAVEDINQRLGGVFVKEYDRRIPIKLIAVDNESNDAKAGTLAQGLILNDHVRFIVNGIDPPFMRAPIARVCERYKVPHITGVGPYEAWMAMRKSVDRPWKYTWTPSFAIATPAKPGDFRYGKLGYCMMDSYSKAMEVLSKKTNRRIAAFASDEPDGRGWYLSFVKFMEGNGGWDIYKGKEEFGLVPMSTIDFTSLIRAWKAYKCEILWANCPGPFFGAMWRQARMLGFKPKMVFATRAAVFYPDIASWGGKLAHGVCNEVFWNPAIKDSPGIAGTTPQSLNKRWIKYSGQAMHQNVGMGYQSVQILLDAIQRAGSLDSEKVNQALRKTDLMTIYHRVVFDNENFSRHPVCFGQWVSVDKPWKWENPVVISYHDFLPATAKLIFPIPYD